ncbi:hypothetical protein [Reinekea marinisedimentorum]|uniref:Uncharacterized protein n=1 Tax=Reinekea marinisedimentorum TaxID=230495 RepID=A0A4V2UK89_9GAMM|nr:hypothetical protein [Reinekea marinisedimentorum]TCS43252.1 hypothetical protein BCF53_102278 [Reinekea marinisedimentorum]
MAEQYYDLTFSGELLEGHFIDFVKADLQAMFKASSVYIDALFSGPDQPVKLKVDKATAIKYQKAFKQAGAKLTVRVHKPAMATAKTRAESEPNVTASAPAQPAAKPQAASPTSGISTTLNAVAGENADALVEHHQPDLQQPESIPQWAVAAPGEQLVEITELPVAEIDTGNLSLADTGTDLLGNELKFDEPAPIINVDALSLAPAGAEIEVLDDKPAPVSVDTSHLKVE